MSLLRCKLRSAGLHALVCLVSVASVATAGCSAFAVGPRIVDDVVLERASSINDPQLVADVKSLHNDRLRGTGDLQAGMCLQQYVRGRAAEAKLASISDDYGRRVARAEMMSGFGSCAAQCQLATELNSKHASIAAKYVERCEAGSNASEQAIGVEHVKRLVALLRDATQPLELFLAHKDATEAIEYLRGQNMTDETLEQLEAEVKSLHDDSAEAIAEGSKFYYSAPAQENLRIRAQLESEIDEVTTTIEQLEREIAEAQETGRAADAQTLGLAHVARRVQLVELTERKAKLQAQYERMAADVGVYVRP